MKVRKIIAPAFAAIILAVVASGTASASTVWFQNPAVAQLYDDSNNGGGYNAAWMSYTPEHVYVSGGDTLAWVSTSHDYSTKVSTCSIPGFYIYNANPMKTSYVN